ncbi:MAG: serine--tRNA ligase, partial [archaeon]|nr:serine--tRNA ligase [archaeon]
MLDIELFRTNLEKIIESEKKRFKDPINAEKVLEYDEKLREAIQKYEEIRQQLNKLSPEIGKLIKSGEKEKAEELKRQVKDLKTQQAKVEQEKKDFQQLRDEKRYIVGNILDESVPVAETEEGNRIEKTYGEL